MSLTGRLEDLKDIKGRSTESLGLLIGFFDDLQHSLNRIKPNYLYLTPRYAELRKWAKRELRGR